MSSANPVIAVRAGRHARRHAPVRVPWTSAHVPDALACPAGAVPCQRDGDALVFIPLPLGPGEEARYAPARGGHQPGVLAADRDGAVEFSLQDGLFTAYRYTDVPARPYFWPVLAPGGVPVTRAWPMSEEDPAETRDHRHHRSLYIAYGDVNGTDNWSEERGHGRTEHRSIDELVSGPVFARLATTSEWVTAGGEPLLQQRMQATAWIAAPRLRMLDVRVTLTAVGGDVVFGDTKEGGILTVRVASPLDVPRGGRIENAYGGIDEGETWGKAAHWCDYSGVVGGNRVGIAVMDHPASFRWPTYWHVRDYGLMAANPFALAAYTDGERDGAHRLPVGQALRFAYRVLLHEGDAADADVRGRYLDWVAPPAAEVE